MNCFFDFLIASSLCAAFGLEALWSGGALPGAGKSSGRTFAVLVVLIATLPAVAEEASHAPHQARAIATLSSRESQTLSEISLLRSVGGREVACEDLALCYRAGGLFRVDFFNFGQKLRTGLLTNSACERAFASPPLRAIQLESSREIGSMFLTPACNEVIRARFAALGPQARGQILVPIRNEPGVGRFERVP